MWGKQKKENSKA